MFFRVFAPLFLGFFEDVAEHLHGANVVVVEEETAEAVRLSPFGGYLRGVASRLLCRPSPLSGSSLGALPSGRSVVPDCILSIANSSFHDINLSFYDNFLLCFRYLVS